MARELKARHDALILSEDELLFGLFGDHMNSLQDFVKYSSRLRQVMRPHILELLNGGCSVILDFQANTIESRAWMKDIIKATGCDHELHWLDMPDEVCKERMLVRNRSGDHPFSPTAEQFDQITRHFQPPENHEGFNILLHNSASS